LTTPGETRDDETPPGVSVADTIRGAGDSDPEPVNYTKVEQEAPPPPPPPAVARYLMGAEIRAGVIAVRQHPIVLALPALVLAGGLLAAIIINAQLYAAHRATIGPVRGIWLAWAAGAAWSAWKYTGWRSRWFVITGTRLMTIGGILVRKVTPLPLKRVRDLELIQPLLGRYLGYGTIECESIATDHALHRVRYLPFTVELWVKIWAQLLPESARGIKFEGIQEDTW
jgi:uncharacterized membrane protein YdbT with pleckstrin-like domain